ncbi:hypothetical protein PVAP13_8NG203301 [Panicum virgatum]|uniref:Uncharacterized protein n=1 Tax=Panicum virgatum TaxID=38727 RepID=A0A8T0PDH8_PANVG|nr:hypothetical protein PVAP13_8NG203301 [Panicum virgatum]
MNKLTPAETKKKSSGTVTRPLPPNRAPLASARAPLSPGPTRQPPWAGFGRSAAAALNQIQWNSDVRKDKRSRQAQRGGSPGPKPNPIRQPDNKPGQRIFLAVAVAARGVLLAHPSFPSPTLSPRRRGRRGPAAALLNPSPERSSAPACLRRGRRSPQLHGPVREPGRDSARGASCGSPDSSSGARGAERAPRRGGKCACGVAAGRPVGAASGRAAA